MFAAKKNSINSFLAALIVFSVAFASKTSFSQMSQCQKEYLVIDKSTYITFCKIPYSNFQQAGSTIGYRDFEMAQFELSQGEFEALVGEKPWARNYAEFTYPKERIGKKKDKVIDGPQYPAVYLSGEDIQKVIKKLNKIDPFYIYRLPNDREWAYAARPQAETTYYWGEEVNYDYVYSSHYSNKNDTRHAQKVNNCPNRERDLEEPGYCANQYGLMHVLGNVWELTESGYLEVPDNRLSVTGDIELSLDKKAQLDLYNFKKAQLRDTTLFAKGGSWTTNVRTTYFTEVTDYYRIGLGEENGHSNVGLRLFRIKK